jgi:hypothetical protein
MKFSSAIVFLSTIASVVAVPASLLKHARRLEENADAAEDEYAFLQGYSLKLLRCKSGETYVSPVDGSYEYSSVVFRLCPNECSNDAKYGCDSGYGDYVVGLNSFAAAYLEAKRDDMQGDDDANDWKFEEFGECRNWEADKDAEMEEGAAFYVGPACSDDSTGVKMGFFTDETCETPSESVSFEDISNGVSLPYATGGLIGNGCESCYGANDKGEMELSEMCTNLYTYSGKCESQMETFHYMGKQEGACETVSSLMPATKSSSNGAGKAIGWVFFALVVVGAAAFGYMQFKKKQDEKRTGLMA